MGIDLSKFEQTILSKLKNKDLKFSEDEIFILQKNSELRNQFYDLIVREPDLFTIEVDRIFNAVNIEDVEFINNQDLIYNYAKVELAKGNYDVVFEASEFIDEEKSQTLFDDFWHIIETSGNDIEVDIISAGLLEMILNRGYFQVLDKVMRIKEPLTNGLIDMLKEYAKKVDIVPPSFIEHQDILQLEYDKYSLNDLISYFNQKIRAGRYINYRADELDLNEQEHSQLNQIYDTIYRKFKSGATLEYNVLHFFEQLINYKKETKFELVEMLVKQIGVDNQIVTALSDELDVYEGFLLQYIKPNCHFTVEYIDDRILHHEPILDRLIECGFIECASQSSLFSQYIERIISKIKSGDEVYKNLVIKNIDYIKRYPELLKVLFEYNMVYPIKVPTEYKNIDTDLYNVILEEVRKGTKMFVPENYYTKRNFLNEVILSRNFETLTNTTLNDLKDAKISDEAVTILIDALSNSPALMDKILKGCLNIILQNPQVLEFYLNSKPYFMEKLLNRINHNETLHHMYTDELFDMVKVYYAEKHSLNNVHLETVKSKFGPIIIRFLDNENIHQLINLSEEEFSMFIQLFPDTEFKLTDISAIYDSIMQYKFLKQHPKVVSVFADIMHSLDDNSMEYLNIIDEIIPLLDEKFINKFSKSYPHLVSFIQANSKAFLLNLIIQIKNNTEQVEYAKEVLHFITNYYIATKREQYRETYNLESDLDLPYDTDEKDRSKKLLRYYLNHKDYYQTIIDKLVKSGMDESLAHHTIAYYLGEKIDCSEEELIYVKSRIKDMVAVVSNYINGSSYLQSAAFMLDRKGLIKRKYKVPEVQPDVYQLLSTLNIKALKNLLSNQQAYHSLKQTIHKYKLHLLPPSFTDLLSSEHIGISGAYTNLSGFISYYDKIYETEKSRLESQGKDTNNIVLSPINIFIYSEVYSSVSSVYSQILGASDAKLIKADPGPNQAVTKTSGNTRLNEAVEMTKNNYLRSSVTIPAFTEDITINEDKVMHIVVGNFTHPSNVTHGERTGACMRIGGLGESLYYFCLTNENGFHIRFENPNTREYISRVSGFRNGNTVFLNELRNSCNSKDYSNADVVEACKKVANLLIEKSKDSPCPIDNVVVHIAYAVLTGAYQTTNFNITGNKVGLPKFYSDISNSGYVLATTSKTAEITPINFDKSKVPCYLPAREKTTATTNLVEFNEMANRVRGVKLLLQGQELDRIEAVVIEDTFIYGMANQDWYIYIDSNLEIHEENIGIDERAKEELESARKYIEAMIPVIEKERAYNY